MKEAFEKYPLAWGELMLFAYDKHNCISIVDRYRLEMDFRAGGNIRTIYAFFDSKEIIIFIHPNKSDTVEFGYGIVNDFANGFTFHTRTEAEEAAFIAAFEILEQRLNG